MKAPSRDREMEKLQQTLKRTVRLCKLIWEERYVIGQIKDYLASEDYQRASDLWNELDYPTQNLLITAPRKGGVFTTEERARVNDFWEVTIGDIDGGFK